MKYLTKCHPEANGKKPIINDVVWTVRFLLENEEEPA